MAKKTNVPDLKKFSGIVQLKEDLAEYQKKIRNEASKQFA